MIPKSFINLYNIPFLDMNYENTIDFASLNNQTVYFNNLKNLILSDDNTYINYTYVRSNTLRIAAHVDNLIQYNYLSFNNGYKTYYCFIVDKKYLNENCTEIIYEVDRFQTFLFDFKLMDSYVDRCHVHRWNQDGSPIEEITAEEFPQGDYEEITRETISEFTDKFIITSTAPMGRTTGIGGGNIDNGETPNYDTPPTEKPTGNTYVANSTPSQNLIYFLKTKEGFCSTTYLDPVGVLTQGYGFTGGYIIDKPVISEAEATLQLLLITTKSFYKPIYDGLTETVKAKITQNQMDALCSFAYNCGVGAYKVDIEPLVNVGNLNNPEITATMKLYNKGTINGELVVLPGLTIRREEEVNLYNNNATNLMGYGIKPIIGYSVDGIPDGVVTDNEGWGARPIFAEPITTYLIDNGTTRSQEEARNDTQDSYMNGLPYGMYFYYMDKDNYRVNATINGVRTSLINTKALSCPTIQNITYAPFLDKEELNIYPVFYDSERFGKVDPSLPEMESNNAILYRVDGYVENTLKHTKTLGTTNKYSYYRNSPNRSWQHESKLLQYPFSYGILTDFISQPITIQYHLIRKNTIDVKAITTISDKCTYSIFVDGYKGDFTGNMEASIVNTNLDLPVASSAYANFMATSKAQYLTTNISAINNISRGALTFNAKGLINGVLDATEGVVSNKAAMLDTIDTPRSVITMGGDLSFSRSNGEKKIQLIRYRLKEQYLIMISDFFAQFGYKQDKLMKPNLRSRYFYNYIKCYKANVLGNNLSKTDLDVIRNIFQNGVTIWHIDRDVNIDKVIPLDYLKDNIEVY